MFVAHWAVLSVVSLVALLIATKASGTRLFSPYLSDVVFFAGLAMAVILAYQFIDRGYFLNTPRPWRRLLIGTLSVIATFVPALAVVIAVVGLFVIR